MDDNNVTYSKEELAEMFEGVNSTHLHLKGEAKKRLKRVVTTTWKINKTIGALELFIKLHESEAKYMKETEWFKQFLDEADLSVNEIKSKKPIPYLKHRQRMALRDEQIENLQTKLENVLEDNDLISKEDHKEALLEEREKWQDKTLILQDKLDKMRYELDMSKRDLENVRNSKDQQIQYYKTQLEKLTAEQ
jgi:hypothetical protein